MSSEKPCRRHQGDCRIAEAILKGLRARHLKAAAEKDLVIETHLVHSHYVPISIVRENDIHMIYLQCGYNVINHPWLRVNIAESSQRFGSCGSWAQPRLARVLDDAALASLLEGLAMQPVSNSASKFLGHPHFAGTVLEIDQIRPWLFDFSCHWVAMSVIT